MKLYYSLAAVACPIVCLSLVSVAMAQDKFVGQKTSPSQRVSIDAIDHADWTTLLQTYVNDQGMVNYRDWKASAAAVGKLDAYLNQLSTADTTKPATREAKLAYWINAYNAVTVRGMLDLYPTKSIRDHTPKLWGFHIWKNLKLHVGGDTINLDSIEHQVLRPMKEPRIHFAIVCASIGCPRLGNQAYTANGLDEQLTMNAKHFFAQPQNFQIDRENNTIKLSKILSWFGKDFGRDNTAMLLAISPYLPDYSARQFVNQEKVTVRYLDYDWGINEQK